MATAGRQSRRAGLKRRINARRVKHALWRTLRDFDRNEYLTRGAALAFYLLLALFPLMIFLASLLAYVPIPRLFDQAVELMSRVVPADAMGVVRSVLSDILQTNKGLLSASILGALFAASGGINAMISALNIAYDVNEGRAFWKRRLVAIGLTILVGLMVLVALVAMALGPEFGYWLANRLGASTVFAVIWPYIRWTAILAFTILSVEMLYFLGPNVRQRFLAQIPGAVIAVSAWLGASYGLGLYLRNFANYNATYGVLGAVVVLMLWLYLSALAILLGAELNAELLRVEGEHLEEKEPSNGEEEVRTAA